MYFKEKQRSVEKLGGYTRAMISAHMPGQPAHVGKSGPLARLQVLQNTGGTMVVSRFETLSVTLLLVK